jgi:hypothetical protein
VNLKDKPGSKKEMTNDDLFDKDHKGNEQEDEGRRNR